MPLERLDFGSLLLAKGKEQADGRKAAGRHSATIRINKRRMAGIARAADVVKHIPGPDESFHGIMTGFYDLMHLLIALLARLQSPCSRMRVSTLCLSARNVQEMVTLLDTGKIGRIDLLCSGFFKRQEKEIFAELLLEFGKRSQRVAMAPSHCKIITLDMEDGRKFTLEGSANLRTNRSLE